MSPKRRPNPKLQTPRDRDVMESRRRQAMSLIEAGRSQADAAREMGVTRQAVSLWVNDVRSSGRKGLASKGKPGRKTAPTLAERKRIESALLKGPVKNGYRNELWTLRRVAEIIARVTGREIPSTTRTWNLLREMGWSCQRPARRARQQDQQEVKAFRTQTWVALKKTPDASEDVSSSPTKAD